jgi:hypothetical protein
MKKKPQSKYALAQRVRAHRDKLRRSGLRPIQIWVPDVRTKKFLAAAHRQSLAIARGSRARADQEFIDAVSWWNEE